MARIMIVEDEPITAADLEQTLAAMGHELAGWSDTGEEAVEKARTSDPDLVLMDIRLRGAMTGLEAAERIREDVHVPVLFLTAFADKATVDRACRAHPYGYLVKPFTERTVAAAVQVALARIDAEREHLERERWASSALRSLGEAIVAVDDAGLVRFLNADAERLLGTTEREVVGQEAASAIRLSDPAAPSEGSPLSRALDEGRLLSSPGHARLLRSDGSERRVSYSAAPMLDERGTRAGAVLVFREEIASDDTAAAKIPPIPGPTPEDPTDALSRRLQHEINNPLTYNLGALSLALRELDSLRAATSLGAPPPAAGASPESDGDRLVRIHGLLRSAHEGAERIAAVMKELRSSPLHARGAGPIEPAELLALALGLCAEPLAHARVEERADPAPVVLGNKWQLARALADELERASALLEPASAEAPRALTATLGTDARGDVLIRVELRGLRAPERASSAAGAPHEGESPREVVARHGGTLVVHDTPEGRVLELLLPPESRQRHAGATPGPRRGRVLVVDDEPMIGRVLEITLQQQHDVTSVQSAEGALALLEGGDVFDVVLCDLSMPGMSGRELYERLLGTRPDLAERMIMMSGGGRSAEDERFLASMEGRRIDKPFRTEELAPILASRVRARPAEAAPG